VPRALCRILNVEEIPRAFGSESAAAEAALGKKEPLAVASFKFIINLTGSVRIHCSKTTGHEKFCL